MKTTKPPPQSAPPLIGAHMSTAGGMALAIDRALSVDCTAMQIFVKNNMQWFAAAPFTEAELRAFHEHPRRGELRSVFGHSGYLINLAAVNPDFAEKSRRALADELARADQLRLPFLVLHPGAHMGAGEEAGLQKIVAGLDEVFAKLPQVKTRVALETTAGQGTSLGHTFEELAWILAHSAHPERLCVCADTAHLFAAGFDLSTEAGTRETFERFDRVIGLERLVAVHCNDSKVGLGSRVDRHEHLGKGKIGLAPFRFLMRDPRFAAIPKVLETPKGKEMEEDRVNLGILRELATATPRKTPSQRSSP
ncbi:MAG: deoxyribonuclease IV [Chthoniobacteraceae bacterium]|nr:deoxyribonuclease IV [Chthoniobacteraceae bacterium]